VQRVVKTTVVQQTVVASSSSMGEAQVLSSVTTTTSSSSSASSLSAASGAVRLAGAGGQLAVQDAAAPAEAPQPGAMGLSGEPVELAGAFLQGDFGDVSDSLLRPQTTADPGNPFAIAREFC
jgi:hypothetical protein